MAAQASLHARAPAGSLGDESPVRKALAALGQRGVHLDSSSAVLAVFLGICMQTGSVGAVLPVHLLVQRLLKWVSSGKHQEERVGVGVVLLFVLQYLSALHAV